MIRLKMFRTIFSKKTELLRFLSAINRKTAKCIKTVLFNFAVFRCRDLHFCSKCHELRFNMLKLIMIPLLVLLLKRRVLKR